MKTNKEIINLIQESKNMSEILEHIEKSLIDSQICCIDIRDDQQNIKRKYLHEYLTNKGFIVTIYSHDQGYYLTVNLNYNEIN